jgi:WD40 repeat protein
MMSTVAVKRLQTLTGHRDCVYTLAPSANPERFFSGSGDGMIVQWDLTSPADGILIAKLPNSVYALQYDPINDVLIAGHNYDGLHFLDWQNKKEIGSLQFTKGSIFDLQCINGFVYAATGDGEVVKIDSANRVIVARNRASEKSARTIAYDPSSGDIAVGFSDHAVRVFDEALRLKHEWVAHSNSVFTLRFFPGSPYLISGSRDARLKVWDVKGGYIQVAEVVAHMYAINHIEFSPDGKHFVTCSMDKSIKVWDLEKLQLLKVIDRARHAGHGTSVNKLLWTSFDNQLLSASDDRTISVWHIIF